MADDTKLTGSPLIKIDLGDLSKPATVLIEKISAAVGALFQPYQVVNLAKAEAEAEQIRAESRIEVGDLERRAVHRWLREEAKRQKNMESITSLALPQLREDSKPEILGDDWISHFFEKSRLISDEGMQRLWSAVLAGEANAPGAFSKSTLNVLAALDKSDAELFTRLCWFAWQIEGFQKAMLKGGDTTKRELHLVPVVFGSPGGAWYSEIYTRCGINYSSLNHLRTLGLVYFDADGFWWHPLPQTTTVFYFGRPLEVHFERMNYPMAPKADEYSIPVGHALLSRAGQELAELCHPEAVDGFFEYVTTCWKNSREPLTVTEGGKAD